MLITSSIPNLINGVSQQPPTLRLASQSEEQVNFLSSVADGLTVRPPSRHLAVLDNADWEDAFIHTINRDVSERYLVVIRNGQLRVFEAETGIERTVNAPDGWAYLNGAGKTDYRAVTVADYTFILNRQKTVKASTTLTPARPNQAMIFVKAGNYGKTYRVTLNGIEIAKHETVDGSTSSHTKLVDTTYIAEELLRGINNQESQNPGTHGDYTGYNPLPAGFTATRQDSLILITGPEGTSFSINAEDGAGGVGIDAIQSQVQRFSDLPKEAPEGFEVEVVGDQSSSFDNYYVKFQTEGANGVGVWKEHAKGGEESALNTATMPHTLVRESDGTFTFSRPEWKEREVGDLEKIPHPSFVDRRVRDIFFFRNRLGFVSDENVIMSQDGAYFDFFRSTATTVLDTDPIDVAVTSERVSILNFAVPFNRTLLLFSDQSQFVLEGGNVLSPQTVAVAQATAFESLPNVRPVGVGQFVYFPVPRGSFAGLREYFVQEGNEQNDALDVTSHVPRYLPRSLSQLAASSSEDTLVALAESAPNSMWVYRFFFNQEGKLQSAWSRWEFSGEDKILSVAFIESRLYMVVSRGGKTFIDWITLESGAADAGSSALFRLDRGVPSEDCTVSREGEFTHFSLPFETAEEITVVVRGDDPNFPEGLAVPHVKLDNATLRIRGDWTGARLVLGQKLTARYLFSTFFMRSSEPGGGVSANADGRLQLRYLSVDYSRTGFFKVQSTPRARNTTEKVFSGRTLGVESGTLGSFNLATGRMRVPIMCRNTDASIEIVCDSHLPASFTAAEWEASFTSRARKV